MKNPQCTTSKSNSPNVKTDDEKIYNLWWKQHILTRRNNFLLHSYFVSYSTSQKSGLNLTMKATTLPFDITHFSNTSMIYLWLFMKTNKPPQKNLRKNNKKPHQPNPNSHQRKQQNQPNKTDQTYLHSYYEIVELLSDSCLKKKKSLCWSLYMAVSQAYLAANVHTLIIHMALRCK